MLVIPLLILLASPVFAELRLPALVSDHMVLQRDVGAPIWGWAVPGEKVTVKLDSDEQTVVADAQGAWRAQLRPTPAGGPHRIVITGDLPDEKAVTLSDVLFGDVWVCSGQSNMEMNLSAASDSAREIAAADYPGLRLFTVAHAIAGKPQADCRGSWSACGPKQAASFSAVAYFFGRDVHEALKIPIGLVESGWNGTPAESWVSRSALEADPDLKPMIDRSDAAIKGYDLRLDRMIRNFQDYSVAARKAEAQDLAFPVFPALNDDPRNNCSRPAGPYNGMIAPLTSMAIKGVVWYQGESNAYRAYEYRKLFSTLIQDWRRAWKQGDFPFLFVQLPNYSPRFDDPSESDMAELREAQVLALSLPNTGMAITIDIGDAGNIHAPNKQDVGKRLSNWALAMVYGKAGVPASGPLFDSVRIEGAQARVTFRYAIGGLVAKGKSLKGFALAGEDREWAWADAAIDPAHPDTVVVSSAKVAKPVAVRYAWAANPACNLCNAAGIPASPFRTDDWPGVTWPKKP